MTSLRPGDLVVHAVHGLAEFRGIESAEKEGGQDLLLLEFEAGATLRVPVSRVDLVERYIGAGGEAPKLDKMGSGAFEQPPRIDRASRSGAAPPSLTASSRRASWRR